MNRLTWQLLFYRFTKAQFENNFKITEYRALPKVVWEACANSIANFSSFFKPQAD